MWCGVMEDRIAHDLNRNWPAHNGSLHWAVNRWRSRVLGRKEQSQVLRLHGNSSLLASIQAVFTFGPQSEATAQE